MIQFLVHEKADSVGVATVDIEAGSRARGLYMDSQDGVEIEVRQDIPLGHKIALREHDAGGGVIKYGEDVGRVIRDIRAGDHVHVHNLKTRRWSS